ncbi:MAG TPA: nucleoside deaminase [Planctomycetes bacterium]|nr:nucleoside deaminase [Planctomycetota bacterium]
MEIALREAAEAGLRGEVPVGAVLVLKNRILARESNRCEELKDPTAHAELLAITTACSTLGEGRLPGAEIYVTLEPCFMCAGALLHARVERIVFGAFDPKFGACGSLADLPADQRLNHRCQKHSGVLGEESAGLLRSFFQERRKKG